MSRTLSPYQKDVAISHLITRRNILLKVYDGVKEVDGQEERSNFLKREKLFPSFIKIKHQ